jgi:hypothetical protein
MPQNGAQFDNVVVRRAVQLISAHCYAVHVWHCTPAFKQRTHPAANLASRQLLEQQAAIIC